MEGIPNQEQNEKVPTSYLGRISEFTEGLIDAAVEKGRGKLALGAAALLSLNTIGCQVNISGGIAGPETGDKIASQFGDYFEKANERARNQRDRYQSDYEFRHKTSGGAAIGIDSSGRKIGDVTFRETKTTRIRPGSMADKQEQNRQDAIRDKERDDNK